MGDQGQALLLLLAERAVASGHIKTPPSWNTFGPATLVSLTVRRWQQRLSAWLHVKAARLLLRQSSPASAFISRAKAFLVLVRVYRQYFMFSSFSFSSYSIRIFITIDLSYINSDVI